MDIPERLGFNSFAHADVLQVLLEYFGAAKMREPCKYEFGEPVALTLTTSKQGVVESVDLTPALKDRIGELSEKIYHSLCPSGQGVIAKTCFSSLPIVGGYRYKDLFQISSFTPKTPIPSFARTRPFILECTYERCGNDVINANRAMEAALRIARLLNLFSNVRIFLEGRGPRQEWTFDQDDTVPAFRHIGYDCQPYLPLPTHHSSFRIPSFTQDIELVPAKGYYDSIPHHSSNLQLPDDIDNSFDRAFALTKPFKIGFDRAVSWIDISESVCEYSKSAAYACLVFAIECLIGVAPVCPECRQAEHSGVDRCQTCNQPMYRSTKAFKEFVYKFCPGLKAHPQMAKTFYKRRSDIVHGKDLLASDFGLIDFLSQTSAQEDTEYRNLSGQAQNAIINWLSQQDRSTPG